MPKIEVFGLDPKRPEQVHELTLPSAWEECSVAQLGIIAAYTSIPIDAEADDATKEVSEAHLRLHLFRELTGMESSIFTNMDPTDLLDVKADEHDVDRVAFLPQVDWCLDAPVFEKSLVDQVTVGEVVFQGPTNRLSKFSLKQWGFCDNLLTNLSATGSTEMLHNLLGALYHVKGTVWSNETIEERAALLSQLDDRTKLAAVMNYRGLRGWLASQYRKCFAGGKADPRGLQGLIVRYAGLKFGDVEQTPLKNVHDVLVHVEQNIEEHERLKDQNPNA